MAGRQAQVRTIALSGAIAAGVVLLLLLQSAPVAADGGCPGEADGFDNYWRGAWDTHHEGTELMELKLRQESCSREVTGTYDHPKDHHGDSGTIEAEAKGRRGGTLNGKYKSTKKSGEKGGFTLELSRNTRDFTGEFWPCRYSWLCTNIDWTGEHHGA